jgi:hypothetical protein
VAEPLLADNRVHLADVRADSAFVRVSWHPEDRQFVVSQWRDNVCVAATRVPVGLAPDLIALLAKGLGDAAMPPELPPPVASSPSRPERWRNHWLSQLRWLLDRHRRPTG